MTDYETVVKNLKAEDIVAKWDEVTPLAEVSGIARSESSSKEDLALFAGHDAEQIKLMEELCIVLDYDDKPVGSGTKKVCHIMDNIRQGLLHRAFSVFMFNADGKLLLQQRADEKITFANMWTNTCCSHPLCVPAELGASGQANINSLPAAVAGAKNAAVRKLEHELGIPPAEVPVSSFEFLTRIHYMSPSGGEDSKWGEHEIDYILIQQCANDITVNANYNEVRDFKWVSEAELKAMFADDSLVFTPWFKLICEKFLFKWWANLKDLDQFKDDSIHRML
ncbi:isopentenyl-diphosphate delta-isomerase [Diutina catenulata]